MVTHEGRYSGSIGVINGKIACITDPNVKINAEDIIDVRGKYIIPGAIDAHAHFQDPGITQREDFEHGTAACAVGGITTVISQPVNNPPVFDTQTYLETIKHYEGRGLVDYGLHGGGSSANLDKVEDLWVQTGSPAIKIMMCYSPKEYGMVDDAQFYQILEKLSPHNGLAYVHAENQALVQMWEDRYRAEGRIDPMAYNASRPAYVEIEAVHRALVLAEQTGCRVIFAHISTAESLKIIAKARRRGLNVYAESCPHFFTFTSEDMNTHGPYLKFSPVMRDKQNLRKMWELLEKGYVHTLATDHCPYEPHEKEVGLNDVWKAPNGVPGLEIMLPVFLNGVRKGMVSLEQVVRATSYNPARIYGLYPRKGVLRPGSDADLAVIDFELEKVFSKKDLKSKCPYSPYIGLTFKGWPVMTLVRGEVVAKNGEICIKPGFGRYFPRY
ncbi:MAG: dihydroorotase [Thermodesulfobacteriota bacterium]